MENTATQTLPAPTPDLKTPVPVQRDDKVADAQPGAGTQPVTGKDAVKNAIAEAVRRYRVTEPDGKDREATEDDFNALLKDHKAKIKMEGQELEVPYEELVKGYQSRQVSAKRFEEAARIMKNAQRFIQLLKSNTPAVLHQLGIDPLEFSKSILKRRIEFENMTDEQRKTFELQEELRQERERRESMEEKIRSEEEANLRNEYQASYTKDIIEGLESVGLPKTEWCVKQIAFYLHHGLKKGIRLTSKQVAPLVKEDLQRHMRQLYGSTDEKEILNVVGEEFAAKVRKADLARLNHPNGSAVNPSAVPFQPKGDQPAAKKMTMEEWKERNRKIMEGTD